MPARARSPAWRRPWVGALEIALVLALPGLCGACDAPPRYQSMKIKGDSKSSYSPGERVDYECRPGYKRDFTLPAHTVCNDDGTWAALQEACTKKACPHPPVPSNGEISSPQGDLLFGSEVHYTCFVGFRLIGSKVIYCEVFDNTMKWSDQPPLCEKVLCRPPEKIPNGKYSNSHKEVFEYGEVVTYTCNPSTGPDEYSLIGTNRRLCSADGNWTGTPPRCEVVKCPYPEVSNGMPRSIIPKKRNYNTTVLFGCLPGFVLRGSDTIRCDADSRWNPPVPTCVPGPKPTVTTPTQASRDPSSKPTPATTTPTSGEPGDVRPSDQPPETSGHLGPGVIAVIVLSTVVGVMLASLGVYKYLQSRKKRETKNSEASFSTYRSKSSSPTEESN
ncbi:membrane cofactor protein isoform X4 [Sorex fumeus]|uniref:membrane cofactor protein isoform X4 n=1 Tax=Sorex fumeus TaxID=62283 RepID=UPI0024ADE1C8|nr:membrane cofactor protein isoform X4 [Sorex fumeus]